ncbi:molybdate ABC transporter substrate-binding protein [Shewanella maritima]|uniref:molybdate ABC transporter substrate-binding protein n=1 Tax=Shewanella maritima TaxID=2520507 RepID=UPI003735F9E8
MLNRYIGGCRRHLLFVLSLLVLTLPLSVRANDVPAIAAASSIKFALDEIVEQFTQDTGHRVRVSYGSSGNFVAQIQHGAPFELLLSADKRYTEQLVTAGLTNDTGVVYAVGKLVLAAPKHSPLELDAQLTGLKALIESGQLKRFTIANPQHAPYGERAQQVLQQAGLWESIQGQLIYGENVSQSAQFAISGSTQGGLVALSLAKSPVFEARANYIEIPISAYTPLEQKMVLLRNAGQTAHAFFDYLQTDTAHAIFQQYGFGKGAE